MFTVMSMRIITGLARGKRLVTTDGWDVRPTPERVKEGIFSAIQFEIEGRRVLDLFAGSGQMGLEALSRGAKSAVFVDSSENSLKTVRKNIEITGFSDRAKTVRSDYAAFCAACRDSFDIVFIDPPYPQNLFEKAVRAVLPLMSDYGCILCEHPDGVDMPEKAGNFVIAKNYRYGKVTVTLYRREDRI